MGKYQSYENCVDSGIERLGTIPRHWKIKQLKFLARLNYGNALAGDIRAEEGVIPVFGSNGVVGTHDRANTKAPAIFVGRKGSFGKVVYSDQAGFCIDTAYFVDHSSGKGNLRWLFYLLGQLGLDNLSQDTGVPGLSREIAHGTYVCVPPESEQHSIAAFLDHETAKIDRLIARQERLMELLKEKRQAVISHAVTKGLNPDAPMKDSGVEWLGEVPAHWDVARVKFVAKLESGHTPSKQVEEYWIDCDIPWVSLNDSKQLAHVDYISDTAYKINQKGIAGSSARLLPQGAVVFTRDATIGLAAITTREMAVSQHLIAWLPRGRLTSLFLLRVFNAMKAELDQFTFGATIKTIGMDDVKALTTTVPPIEEQEAICKYVDDRLSKLDLLTEKVERQIGLLREHRVSLISAAVTGKIDVRGWQEPSTEPQETATAVNA